ncbi:hypothetical protein CcrColossus_gp371 [Caulobacter phage CcrColossus]|uniref:Uncharacterized protein n=1 Tax=Caulobacter phage CcrColossus TaxID=1211640 RepID=K4JSX2_9CAUD|nr:hypothetical protein CcrColossus_gp371 [Caulobacter phage CcrColossus]AFU88241.1 hypothetical protein CcrColossus_gp371 [Caulobacter phage CcrColossus]
MKIGTHPRQYSSKKTEWIVRGFSKQIGQYVYPKIGWSWTEWVPEIADTYETHAEAVRAISAGYLKSMIETQEIVDIIYYERTIVHQIDEVVTIVGYDANGQQVQVAEPTAFTDDHIIQAEDYLLLGDRGVAGIYAQVLAVRDGEAFLWVLNGCWKMRAQITPDGLVMDGSHGAPHIYTILHHGPVDPSISAADHEGQTDAWARLYEKEAS